MRISDWSSDVCSSDLTEKRTPRPATAASSMNSEMTMSDKPPSPSIEQAADRQRHQQRFREQHIEADHDGDTDQREHDAAVGRPGVVLGERQDSKERSDEHTSELQ